MWEPEQLDVPPDGQWRKDNTSDEIYKSHFCRSADHNDASFSFRDKRIQAGHWSLHIQNFCVFLLSINNNRLFVRSELWEYEHLCLSIKTCKKIFKIRRTMVNLYSPIVSAAAEIWVLHISRRYYSSEKEVRSTLCFKQTRTNRWRPTICVSFISQCMYL